MKGADTQAYPGTYGYNPNAQPQSGGVPVAGGYGQGAGSTAPYPSGPPVAPMMGYPVWSHNNKPVQEYQVYDNVVIVRHGMKHPLRMWCLHCQQEVTTEVHKRKGILPWLCFGLLCATHLWLCACLPFCLPGCSVREHLCPRCHRVLAAGN